LQKRFLPNEEKTFGDGQMQNLPILLTLRRMTRCKEQSESNLVNDWTLMLRKLTGNLPTSREKTKCKEQNELTNLINVGKYT